MLEEKHKIDRRVRLRLDKIEKIFTWPVSQDQTVVKAFFRTIQLIQC